MCLKTSIELDARRGRSVRLTFDGTGNDPFQRKTKPAGTRAMRAGNYGQGNQEGQEGTASVHGGLVRDQMSDADKIDRHNDSLSRGISVPDRYKASSRLAKAFGVASTRVARTRRAGSALP